VAVVSPLEQLLASLPWEGQRTRLTAEESDGGRGSIAISRGNERLGTLRMEAEDDTLTAWSLVIEPAFRGYGAGSEAAHLLRDHAVAAGFQRLRAVAAADLGLSVYFWTRMGLHPLHGEGPHGGLWFERTLAPAPSHQGTATV
jgi:GNAT superfamily N-acetyltransferase